MTGIFGHERKHTGKVKKDILQMKNSKSDEKLYDEAMYSHADAVVPIFLEKYDDDNLEHIGSAVLLQLQQKLFVLTAAHVADYHVEGTLCMPVNGDFMSIKGGLASLGKPDRQFFRKSDPIDVAYILCSEETKSKILEEYKPIKENECWFYDNALPNDTYSVSGYPLTKTKERDGVFSGEAYNYTGEAAIGRKYQQLSFDTTKNIIINFRLKQSIDLHTGIKKAPPHPKGASGGAILRWPKSEEGVTKGIERGTMRQLCGIIHTYKKQHNCMVGTKLGIYIDWIYKNNPELAPTQNTLTENAMPMYTGFIMYLEEDWEDMKEHAADSSTMCDSWAQWRDGIERGLEHMYKNGTPIVPSVVTSSEMKIFCQENSVPNNASSRIQVCNRKLYEALQEQNLDDQN